MEPIEPSINLTRKRRSDFYTGIVILLVSLAMLFESFTFPMKESYAGVDNVWYVSPALLPILVSSLLILLSLILIRKSIQDGGMKKAAEDFPNIYQAIQSENFLRFIVIVLYISIYVYGLIPNSDFYLASMVFLFSFVTPFYLDRNDLFLCSFWPYLLVGSLIGVLGYLGLFTTVVIDLALIALMIFMSFFSWLKINTKTKHKRKWLIAFSSSIITPLILIPAFKFGLLVPLPTEGIIIKLMEKIAF